MIRFSAYRFLLVVALISLFPFSLAAQATAQDHRIENEVMLHLPAESVEGLWSFLQERFAHKVELAGREYTTRVAVEEFKDQYFDTIDLRLLKSWNGLRHRQRVFEDGSLRELVQLKLTPQYRERPESQERKEFKFQVSRVREPKAAEDRHPLLQLLRNKDRIQLARVLERLEVKPLALRPFILLRQERRRVYFNDGKEQVFTLTLDRTSGGRYWVQSSYDQIELEIGEKVFTEAGKKKRQRLLELQEAIYQILLEYLPGLTQDQRPKVVVMYDLLVSQNWLAWLVVSYGLELVLILALVLAGLLGFLAVLLLKKCWR